MNTLGPVAALTAFLSIWFGHVAVRKIESISPTVWLPTVMFAASGIIMEYIALMVRSRELEAICGILGITLIFDAYEFTRQQRRVRKGHAPANPGNPRHSRFLAEPNSRATTVDLLKREPRDS
ncbi:MAG TPA: DUF4491 family protein [Anaerolineales bacterium]